METPKNKLDHIEAKQPFTVPDGYFDKLPNVIQAKATSPKRQSVVSYPLALKYALPVVALTIAVIFWLRSVDVNTTQDVHQLLSEIPSNDIIDYLEESDLALMDIIESLEDQEYVFDNYMNEDDTISAEDMSEYLEDYELTGEFL
jgi:hypothetical protein